MINFNIIQISKKNVYIKNILKTKKMEQKT